MYIFPQEQGILYTSAELSGGLWPLFYSYFSKFVLSFWGVWKRFECCTYL